MLKFTDGIPRKLFFQVAFVITFFIFIIEGILLVFSVGSEERKLDRFNQMAIESVRNQIGQEIAPPISEAEKESLLDQYIRNIILLVLVIVLVTVGGTLVIFQKIVGRHVMKLKTLNERASLKTIEYYPETQIPNNELGEVIQAQNQMIRRLVESTARMTILGDIAAGISHEINTPLHIIHTNAQLIEMTLKSRKVDDPETLENLDLMKKTVMKLSRIVKGIHSLSRNAEEDSMADVSLKELIDDLRDFSFSKVKSVEATLTLPEISEDVVLYGRSYQIFQSVLNLIKNACDAVEELDEKWIKLDYETTPDSFRILVIDSGKGISDEIQKDIFTPYFTSKQEGKGTGLGLGLAKAIAEQHGGKLSYQLHDGHTCFVMEIPQRRQKAS